MTKKERFCKKCKEEIKDLARKFCSKCGGKVVTRSEHHRGKRKIKIWIVLLSILLFILIITLVVIFIIPFSYKAVEGYRVKEPYSGTEYYYEKEPYTSTEDYIDWETSKNCDYDRDCSCKHYSIWGYCDSCKCYRERSVTKYRNDLKYRTVTRYKDVYKEREVWKKATLYQMWSGRVRYYYQV